MNEALVELDLNENFNSIEQFIKDDEKSAEFIRFMLHDPDYNLPDPKSALYDFAKARARHSVITFLAGLALGKFGGLLSELNDIIMPDATESEAEKIKSKLWLITSLYHDRAYHSEHLKNGNLNYSTKFKYNLLTDEYEEDALSGLNAFSKKYVRILAHTYEQILLYDIYAREYHKDRKRKGETEVEMLDHGILGGILVFNKLVSNFLKQPHNEIELLIIKTSCLTIAQHNIYKSDSEEQDEKYGDALAYLYHDAEFKITAHTPLLLLMSLVDTLECVKKFSKGNNQDNSLETLTVLSNINIYVDKTRIIVDCSNLHKKTDRSGELAGRFQQYVDAVIGLEKWTDFRVENVKNSDIFCITLQDGEVYTDKNLVAAATV